MADPTPRISKPIDGVLCELSLSRSDQGWQLASPAAAGVQWAISAGTSENFACRFRRRCQLTSTDKNWLTGQSLHKG